MTKRTEPGPAVDLRAVARIRGELADLVRANPELVSAEKRDRLAGFLRQQHEGAMATGDDRLTQVLPVRVHPDDLARLDALEQRLPLKRQDLARAALRLGMAAIERDAAALLSPDALRRVPPKAKPKR